ncbi:Crooked neck-like protein 1 [Armadillidium nasatum]|uniref:Crooked neck-like protein 1 n=1 Tax=Armadillidium nasatum TaxID=96803 RepID=A0A5N5SSS3_9CRUS|nr:Crooked neck-like protein 1 [Armadillidium nasatum]
MAAKPQKMPKVAKVKDKSPAEIQITSEQMLREAKERDLEIVPPPPKQKISDPEELQEYRLKKRKSFEDNIRKNRGNISNWLKYSKWEEEQGEIRRARSVYERALDVDHRSITLWLKYAEMEMRSRQVNHSRNVWDRAVTILPRANQFWYKYSYMEEMLRNIAGAREVFERWMAWEPDEQAWMTYIKFELRYKELDRARAIYERFVYVHPDPKNWIKYARFEENHGYINGARRVYERAIEFFGDENLEETLFIAFAKFEENQKEHDRTKTIYRYALDHMPKEKCLVLYNEYTKHEKKYGDKSSIDDVITSKRKFQYEEALKENSHDYDTWFDYIRMMEADGNVELTRGVYERAIACVPPIKGQAIGMCPKNKLFRGYIDLEIKLREFDRCRKLYEKWIEFDTENCKTWIQFSTLESMLNDIDRARGIYELAVSQQRLDMPEFLWKSYIDFETELEEWDRVRNLYERLLERTSHVKVWISYAKSQLSIPSPDASVCARSIFQRANKCLRGSSEKEQRLMLLEAWLGFEKEYGSSEYEEKVEALMPKKVTKRRQITTDDGTQTRWEEYIDYVFPDDQAAKPSLLLLAKAKQWAKQRQEEEEEIEEKQQEVEDENMEDLDKDDSDVEIGSTGSSSSSSDEEENEVKEEKSKSKRDRKRLKT